MLLTLVLALPALCLARLFRYLRRSELEKDSGVRQSAIPGRGGREGAAPSGTQGRLRTQKRSPQ